MLLYLIPGIFMDAAAMVDAVATVAGADGADAVPGGNVHAAFYNTFCDIVFWVFCNAHGAWVDAAALVGAAVHRN